MARPGMEFRLQAAARGNTRWLEEFSTRPIMLPPCRLKAGTPYPEVNDRARAEQLGVFAY